MKPTLYSKGFTLIELMLVVAIIGLLAAIAIPKFANLVVKAKEAAARGKLGTFRSALSLYYADNEGNYPSIAGLQGVGAPPPYYMQYALVPKYMNQQISIDVPSAVIHKGGVYTKPITLFDDSNFDIAFGDGSVGWVIDTTSGKCAVNCSHTDTKGTTWSLW
ncbi:MAG: prepilin-type N-terminal cleavage/methylation domain-containing protein [Elusimicrobia bacterium]|nr:prepilin-type N-terminal cleavage/methylation domain-containing protein [Elusimicrobiota bacterium]